MKKFLILILTMIIFGCSNKVQQSDEQDFDVIKYDIGGSIDIYEITIDGCSYMVYEGFKQGGITHKANCLNHKDK